LLFLFKPIQLLTSNSGDYQLPRWKTVSLIRFSSFNILFRELHRDCPFHSLRYFFKFNWDENNLQQNELRAQTLKLPKSLFNFNLCVPMQEEMQVCHQWFELVDAGWWICPFFCFSCMTGQAETQVCNFIAFFPPPPLQTQQNFTSNCLRLRLLLFPSVFYFSTWKNMRYDLGNLKKCVTRIFIYHL